MALVPREQHGSAGVMTTPRDDCIINPPASNTASNQILHRRAASRRGHPGDLSASRQAFQKHFLGGLRRCSQRRRQTSQNGKAFQKGVARNDERLASSDPGFIGADRGPVTFVPLCQ